MYKKGETVVSTWKGGTARSIGRLLQLASTVVGGMAERMLPFGIVISNRDTGPSHVGGDRALQVLKHKILVTLPPI
jgi:hypothetical protein